MYRIKEIIDSIFHLVGWKQDYDPSKAIDTALTQSESGLYFQQVHPLLTLENIRAIIPENYFFKYPAYDAIKEYHVGDKVSYGADTDGKKTIWISIQDSVGQTPITDSIYWEQYNFLSDYLADQTANGISTAILNFLNAKTINEETKTLLDRKPFFDATGRINDTINNTGKICGYEIALTRSMGVTAKIERIGLQFTGAVGIVKVYLFHSSQVDPVKTFQFQITDTRGTYKWFDVSDCYLPYISDDNNAGGSWFLCYDQTELPVGMKAINVSKDWTREPCGGCNVGNVQTWRELTKYVEISPFNYPSPPDFDTNPEIWDISKNRYTNATCYGLNIVLSVGCDLTDFIISQRSIFADVIAKQTAVILLRTMAMNPDVLVNRYQSNIDRMNILYEIDGNTAGERPGGLGNDLKIAYKALSLNTEKLDRICLSCNNRGVRYGTT